MDVWGSEPKGPKPRLVRGFLLTSKGHSMSTINYLSFKPSTKGEILFQYIIREVIGRPSISQIQNLDILQIGGRLDDFSEYFAGVFAANIMARCIKKAEKINTTNQNDIDHQRILVRYIQDSLEIPRSPTSGDLDRLAFLILESEKSSRRDINNTTRQQSSSRGLNNCYICGKDIYQSHEDKYLKLQLEHIWPQSFGGDSNVENLLPACYCCNEEKSSMLLWQNSNVHSFVLKPNPSEEETKSIRRKEKIAQHRRSIFQYACTQKTTLKQAAQALGPVDLQNIKPLDSDDAVDFFNFYFA